MSRGETSIGVQPQPPQGEAAVQALPSDPETGSPTAMSSAGPLPPIGGGFADAPPTASDQAFGTHDVAAQGVAGSAQPLPHASQIAQSFGRHSPVVDGIQAH